MNKKYQSYLWVYSLIAVAAVLLVNVLMTKISKRVPVEVDLTANKRYELSEASYAYLKKYDVDTDIYIVASEIEEDKAVRAVLEKYQSANKHIALKNADIESDPSFGGKYTSGNESLEKNSVIVDGGEKFTVIAADELYEPDSGGEQGLNAESKITSALKYVSSGAEEHSVCFTAGHGEEEFKGAVEAMRAENYTISKVTLSLEELPEDTAMVIIANPTEDFTNDELAKLDYYVRRGGNIQLYVTANTPSLSRLNEYLEKNGISVKDNIIVDRQAHVGNSTFVTKYVENDVTGGLDTADRYTAYKGFSKWIDYAAVSGASEVSAYLTAMDGAVTMKSISELENDNINHYESPAIAMMSENKENGGKIFVCGNTLLLDYGTVEISEAGYDNIAYFTAVTNYMCTDDAEVFTVPVKSTSESRLVVTESAKKIWLAVIIVFPLLWIAAGVVVFLKRRHM